MRCITILFATLSVLVLTALHSKAAEWALSGNILSPTGIIPTAVIAITDTKISAVGPAASTSTTVPPISVDGIILPGFIELHNHLTWNVLPRWSPGRKFNTRYEWQDIPEYERVLIKPHEVVLAAAACESEIYAEIKALAGGATSVIGGLLKDPKYPQNEICVAGLARNLDTDSGLPFIPPVTTDPCNTIPTDNKTLLDVIANEVFPFELPQYRFDYLLCQLSNGTLRGLIVHLAEGAPADSNAHREFTMLAKQFLFDKDKKPLVREGLTIVHGTALRDHDFIDMKNSKVGLVWSPRSNDELYGSTTNVTGARFAGVSVAIAPDWSPSGSSGMLQEMNYAARRYGAFASSDLIAMATSVPAKIVRINDYVGTLEPKKLADFIVVDVKVDAANPKALDAVVNASPANISLVVVGGQPVYGNPALLAKLAPGIQWDQFTVCGVAKAVALGKTGAGNQSLAQIVQKLKDTLANANSTLAEIECR